MDENQFIALVTSTFKMFDKKNDGVMEGVEVTDALNHFAKQATLNPIPKTQIEPLIKKYDLSKDKKINFDEFSKLVKEGFNLKLKANPSQSSRGELQVNETDFMTLVRNVFKLYDKKGDGVLEGAELSEALNHFAKQSNRPSLSKADVESLSKKHDINKDKKIDFDEFVNLIKEGFGIVYTTQ